jgi:hypothetical protein
MREAATFLLRVNFRKNSTAYAAIALFKRKPNYWKAQLIELRQMEPFSSAPRSVQQRLHKDIYQL